MTDARGVIAATLRNTPWPDTEPYPDALAGDILHDLQQNGWAVVKLPEQVDPPEHWHRDLLGAWPAGEVDEHDEPVSAWPDGVALPDGTFIPPETARALAAALLAAANKADTNA